MNDASLAFPTLRLPMVTTREFSSIFFCNFFMIPRTETRTERQMYIIGSGLSSIGFGIIIRTGRMKAIASINKCTHRFRSWNYERFSLIQWVSHFWRMFHLKGSKPSWFSFRSITQRWIGAEFCWMKKSLSFCVWIIRNML